MSKRSHKILIWAILIVTAKLVDSDPQKCYQCNSKLDKDCLNFQDGIGVTCKDNEKCVTLVDNEGSTIRGCESSIDCTPNTNCQLCSDNLCNSNIYPKDRKQCIHCKDDNCVNPSELTNMTKICNTYEVNQKCYTAVEGVNVQRGCSSDVNIMYKTSNEYYKLCDDNECNDEPVYQSCIVCFGTFDMNERFSCFEPPVNGTNCQSFIGQEECYTYSNGFLMVRGCSGTADLPILCSDNPSDICVRCTGYNCNNQRGDASNVRISILLTLVSFLILLIK